MKFKLIITILFGALGFSVLIAQENEMQYNPLTPEEKAVIIDKGTEQPYSGQYDNFYESGTYICKRCNAPLYKSEDKFDANCGWPSFDNEIPGAVDRQPDPDGGRVEILCKNCGAHLGHVFLGEGFTEKNVRHCVNSVSMNFIPAIKTDKQNTETAIFAGGCFWGVEHFFYEYEGVISTTVGYTGGRTKNPTYEEVLKGNTGHVEALEVVFDPAVVSYEKLARLFFEIHDPTQRNRQGQDIGYQYRSAIFFTNDEQRKTAKKLIHILEDKGYTVATTLEKAGKFWKAEEYHQDYYQKNGQQPYCHIYQKRF